MRVFVFKEEIGWPAISQACAITVVSVAAMAQKHKGPLWDWGVIVGFKLLGHVCTGKKEKERETEYQRTGASSFKWPLKYEGEERREGRKAAHLIHRLISFPFILLRPTGGWWGGQYYGGKPLLASGWC